MIKHYHKLFVTIEEKRAEYIALMEFNDHKNYERQLTGADLTSQFLMSHFWTEVSYEDDLCWILIKTAAVEDYYYYNDNIDVDEILSEILNNSTNKKSVFYSIVYDISNTDIDKFVFTKLQCIRKFHNDESLMNDEVAVVLNLQTKMLYLTSLGGFLSRAREI